MVNHLLLARLYSSADRRRGGGGDADMHAAPARPCGTSSSADISILSVKRVTYIKTTENATDFYGFLFFFQSLPDAASKNVPM